MTPELAKQIFEEFNNTSKIIPYIYIPSLLFILGSFFLFYLKREKKDKKFLIIPILIMPILLYNIFLLIIF